MRVLVGASPILESIRAKPIIFSGSMVKAILEGRKTMTRRLVTLREFGPSDTPGYDWTFRDRRALWNDYRTADLLAKMAPYAVGDTLWVREAWRVAAGYDKVPPRDLLARRMTVLYEAGGSSGNERATDGWTQSDWPPAGQMPDWVGKSRRSFHMPRWASRIDLRVTSVRVERLQDINAADAIAEGGQRYELGPRVGWRHDDKGDTLTYENPRDSFAVLWDSMHGEHEAAAWRGNPWVWVIGFQREGA